MSENLEKLKYGNAKDIENQGEVKQQINTRSTPAFLYTAVIGAGLLLLNFKYHYWIGGAFILFGVVGFFLMKNVIVVEIYEHSLICYDVFDHNKAICFQFEDIQLWDVDLEKTALVLHLKDGSSFEQYCPRTTMTYEALQKVMPEQMHENLFQKALNKVK